MLNSHAPQVISTVTGLAVGLLAMVGLSVSAGTEGLIAYAVALVVPPVLGLIGGKLTEGYTYAKKTVDRITGEGR